MVIESVFGWPGIGSLLITSAQNRDYTVVMGLAVFFAVIVVFANLLTDIFYGVADPRVQYIGRGARSTMEQRFNLGTPRHRYRSGQEERARLRQREELARAWRRFRGNKMALAALTVVGLLVLMALCAPLISKYITHVGPAKQSLLHQFEPMSRSHCSARTNLAAMCDAHRLRRAVSLGVAFTAVLAAILSVRSSVRSPNITVAGWRRC